MFLRKDLGTKGQDMICKAVSRFFAMQDKGLQEYFVYFKNL